MNDRRAGGDVRLTDLRRGEPVLPDADGVFGLQTETDYLLSLPAPGEWPPADDPRRRWVTVLAPGPPVLVRLALGSFVGRATVCGCSVRATSPLLTDEAFGRMTAELARFAAALPFVEPSPTEHPAAPRPAPGDEPAVLCHRLALLADALGGPSLPPWLHLLARRPATGRRAVAAQIAAERYAGERLRLPALLAAGPPGPVPVQLDRLEPDVADANRLLAAMLGAWRRVACDARTAFGWNGSLIRQADRIVAALDRLERLAPWLGSVGPRWGPATATVWTHHIGYRSALRLHLSLSRPLGPFAWDVLMGLRDGAALYEAWTLVTLLNVLSARLGSPVLQTGPLLRVEPTGIGLRRGVALRFPTGHELHYNPTYTAPSGSYSLAFRPDLALERPDGGRHLLDAKFRGDPDTGTGPTDELAKMHAYRDAIRGVRSVWAVHPGADFRAYPAEGATGLLTESRLVTDNPTGVGLVSLHPDRRADFLLLLDRLLA